MLLEGRHLLPQPIEHDAQRRQPDHLWAMHVAVHTRERMHTDMGMDTDTGMNMDMDMHTDTDMDMDMGMGMGMHRPGRARRETAAT